MNPTKITISLPSKATANEWQVWLPHTCAPDEPIDAYERLGWGDFYFASYDEAVHFVRVALRTGAWRMGPNGTHYYEGV